MKKIMVMMLTMVLAMVVSACSGVRLPQMIRT